MNNDIFTLDQKDSGTRCGTLQTRRGSITTPFFMPDATRASVRGLTNKQLHSIGVVSMVVNTYHLLLQPGVDLLQKSDGVHALMQWDEPLLSDSGGYQVYSLIHRNAKLGRITENGAEFRSVLDGSLHVLTPERAMQAQFVIGTDMMVVLDDPRPTNASRSEHEKAVARTIRWAQLCKDEFKNQIVQGKYSDKTRPLLFAVVQGGPYNDLRKKCADALIDIDFDGYSFGGRHIDHKGVFMEEIVAHTAACLPIDKPRFALGVGTPEDIVRCHALGWDLFDCVIPTREGRHGRIFVFNKESQMKFDVESENFTDGFYNTFNIKNGKFKEDFTPIDARCDCYACENYSRAYLHHLFRVGEPLGAQMASLHNLRFYMQLMDLLQKKSMKLKKI